MFSNNRPIPQGGTQRPNLSQKYSVLGPLSGGSTKPGPLDPDLYYLFSWNITNRIQRCRPARIVIDKKFQLLPLLGGYVTELYRATVNGVLPDKL